MGSGRFDADAYRSFARSTSGKSTDEIYSSRAMHKNLNPFGVKVRESRDSADNPNSTPLDRWHRCHWQYGDDRRCAGAHWSWNAFYGCSGAQANLRSACDVHGDWRCQSRLGAASGIAVREELK
jgi:hypothetical protein